MSLEGKVALVTGASRGIGRGIADYLARCGMKVALNSRSEGAVEATQTLQAEGLRALAVTADVSHKTEVDEMINQVESELGPLWLLVNNAGVLHPAPTIEMSEEAWDRAFAVDAKGVFLCSQAAIRRMIPRQAGRIVNISSIAGVIVRTNQIGYCSAKAAVIHFSRCLAVEMAPHQITVNCLCPGMTRTGMLMQSARENQLDLDGMQTLIPMGRMAETDDHASLVAYFASEEARHVTGQVVCVDGAQSQYLPLGIRKE